MAESELVPVLPYSPPPPQSMLMRVAAVLALLFALLGFPVGAAVSIIMEMYPRLFSDTVSERCGFMVFAFMEGISMAAGIVSYLRLRAEFPPPRLRHLAYAAGIAGGIGSAAVVVMIFIHAIR